MATDPVKQIRELEHDSTLASSLEPALARLAAAPPSLEAPYLTVCLDWQPEGSAPGRLPPREPLRSERLNPRDIEGAQRRPARQEMEREFATILESLGPRGAAFDSVQADIARIDAFLDEELDPAAQGVIFVTCQHEGIFEPLALDVPVPTSFTTGAIPALQPLVHVNEDFPSYAVLVAEQRDAMLWIFARHLWERGVKLAASDYPRHQQQGGWSQRRYQNRAGERVEAFARTIAAEVREAMGEGPGEIPYLIIAADEPMHSAITAELHERVKERVIGQIGLAMETNASEAATAGAPLVEEQERRREAEAVAAIGNGLGPGGVAVAGAEDTLTALQAGQVLTLVVNDDFTAPGWADFTLPLFGAGAPPATHPAGGDAGNLVGIPLIDVLLRLALQSGASIELVKSVVPMAAEEITDIPEAGTPPPRTDAATALDAHGGVGALLRFALDADQSTARL